MDQNKLLQIVRRIRRAYAASDRDLEQLERELEKAQVPDAPRKRKNLKEARIEEFDRMYAAGKWSRK